MRDKNPVLVVHRSRKFIEGIRAALEPFGFHVEEASPQEASTAVQIVNPKFVLLAPCVPQAERGQLLEMLEPYRDRFTVFQLQAGWVRELHKLVSPGSALVQ